MNSTATICYAISYIRWSSARQTDGDSFKRQSDAFTLFCERNGLTPIHHYCDKAKSASKGEHLQGDFGRFLDDVKAKRFPKGSVLVVEAIDRYSRQNPIRSMALLQDIALAGIDIGVTMKGRIYTVKDLEQMGTILEIMIELCAAYEMTKKLKERIDASWETRRQAADGFTKHGRKSKTCPSWIEVSEDGKTYIKGDKWAAYREACLAKISGEGNASISARLPVGTGLHKTFRSRTLLGEFQPLHADGSIAGPAVEGYYDALLSHDEYRQLQARIESQKTVITRGVKNTSGVILFSGLLFSEGIGMKADHGNSGHIFKRKDKRGKTVLREVVESAVMDRILTIEELSAIGQPSSETANLGAQIADLEDKQGKLEKAFNASGDATILQWVVKNNEAIATLKTEREAIERQAATAKIHNVHTMRQLWLSLPNLEGEELRLARLRLAAAVATTVQRIDLEIENIRSCTVRITMNSGEVFAYEAAA